MTDVNQAVMSANRADPWVRALGGWRLWWETFARWVYDNQLLLLVFFGLLLLIPVGIWWWRNRPARKLAAAMGQKTAAAPPSLPKTVLSAPWERFVASLPREARRYATTFPHHLVLGDAGSGKSEVISRYTDWQGMARQFLPSLTDDPHNQVYLGSNVIVQEYSSALLSDSSEPARAAFNHLWRRLYRFREPRVVVVISADALQRGSADELRNFAQAVRGKLGLLTSLRRKVVRVTVVVSRCERIEGWTELSRLLGRHNLPVGFVLHGSAGVAEVSSRLAELERWLPLALTTLSSEEYLRLMRFFKGSESLELSLRQFLTALSEEDVLIDPPQLTRLLMTGTQASRALGNPFSLEEPLTLQREASGRRRRHLVVAGALSLIALGPMINTTWERGVAADETHVALKSYARDSSSEDLEAAAEALNRLETGTPPAWLCGGCYLNAETELRHAYTEIVREKLLLPTLRGHDHEGASVRTLYTLGVLYASRGSPLDLLLGEDATHFARVIRVPATHLAAYAHFSIEPWFGDVDLSGSRGAAEAMAEPMVVERWLESLVGAMLAPVMDPQALQDLKATGMVIEPTLLQLQEFTRTRRVSQLLGQLERPGLRLFLEQVAQEVEPDPWLEENYEQLLVLLEMINNSTIPTNMNPPTNFHDLLGALRQPPAVGKEGPTVYYFKLDQRSYSVRDVDWGTLIARSHNQQLIEAFVGEPRSRSWSSFFRDPAAYRSIELRSSRTGLVGGEGLVAGIYTSQAFQAEVKELLQNFDARLARYPVSELGRRQLTELIDEQSGRYAEDYSDAWRSFYNSFRLRPASVSGLLAVLEEMARPNSTFDIFLREVNLHTSVMAEANEKAEKATNSTGQLSPYLEQVATELADFTALHQLASRTTGKGPLDDYKALLEELSAELLRDADTAGDREAAEINFVSRLPPAGRLAYAILADAPDSFEKRVRVWLSSAGIRAPFDAVFMSPVEQLYGLGIRDVETQASFYWQQRLEPMTSRALTRFPFRRGASVEIAPSEIENLFGPEGEFWREFELWIQPVCERRGGRWRPRVRGITQVQLPPGVLTTTNSLEELRTRLWRDGEPRPLVLALKPLPLERPAGDGWQILSSHLRVGQSSVKGFNQQPSWRSIEVPWWTGEDAQVAVVVSKGPEQTVVLSLEEPGSQWGLLRLLELGTRGEGDVWTWRFEGQGGDLAPKTVEFGIRDDEWRVFSATGNPSLGWARSP